LANGVRVLLAPDPDAEMIALTSCVGSGSMHDPPGSDLAHLVEHLTFFTVFAAAPEERAALSVGVYGDAWTSLDATCFNLRALPDQLPEAIAYDRRYFGPLQFTQQRLEQEQQSVLQQNDERDPDQVVLEELLWRHLFRVHPYGSAPVRRGTVRAVSAEQANRFHREHYVSGNLTLALCGAFDEARALALLQHHHGALSARAAPPARPRPEPPQGEERRLALERDDVDRSRLSLLYRAPALSSPDYPAALVLGRVLHQRLERVLWKRHRLYDRERVEVPVAVRPWRVSRFPAALLVQVDLAAPDAADAVEQTVTRTITGLTGPPGAEERGDPDGEPAGLAELEVARRETMSVQLLRLQKPEALAAALAEAEALAGHRALLELPERLQAVGRRDLARVARRYLRQDQRVVLSQLKKEAEP
jgi:predicted Zn-dependent peptidase